ncbi:DUF4062 domain-containing protein [Methanobrevibacter sp.]|uniref:DUF4062 domain-containing protein n=1 Tax=Methanobrevibacter sp. TaxID=66852 RepID=UPI0038669D51
MESHDNNWKDAIVFISSTFNDMHAERDYLVKEVFPELTEWCERRHIRLTDIDLRWGVTEEDSSNSKTIETCLRHVDKSRPFFLCFLGQRRGWVPDFERDISEETKEYYKMKDLKDRSATEMEIEHALLKPLEISIGHGDSKQSEECRHSLFFFRNGEYADVKNEILTPHQRQIYTNEYLKVVDISRVMSHLKGNDDEKGKDPALYKSILDELKGKFSDGTIEHPEFISELIYDIQDDDCEYYNNLINDLVENPTKGNNLTLIAELKFKNPGLYKQITHEIKDSDEDEYDALMAALEDYTYNDVGIDEFCELYDYEIIKEIISEINIKNEEVFEVHENELVNIREKIEEKRDKAEADNKNLNDNEKVHVVINDYRGHWNQNLTLPELSHYKFGEGQGKLKDFECDGVPLKDVIISEFKKQFEMEFKEHIQKIANKNPEIYDGEESDIIEIILDESISDEDRILANELDQQENFCHNNSEGFVKRDEYTGYLKEYVDSEDRRLCLVTAEAGLGKTMLLADFATNFDEYCENRRLYKRFCGGSDLSSKTYSLWKSIIDEAKIDRNEEIYPQNIVDLRRNINDILKEMSKDEEVVIIIDAINQMEDGMEMINWFAELPENLKLIISAKEINLNKNDETDDEDESKKAEREKQREIDKKYQDKLDTITKKNTIYNFSLKKLDYRKEEFISDYVDNLKRYVESDDDGICVINSEANYDKSLIFHIFNDKYSDGRISNFRCVLNSKLGCPNDKIIKSVREFGKKSSIDLVEITGNAKAIKTKLEGYLAELENDSIVIIDLMSNDKNLIEELENVDYKFKTVIGVKSQKDEIIFKNQSENSFTINELDSEKKGIIKSYLSNYLKELDEKEIHDICNFKGSKNPLFLKILLAELRVFGSFDQLKDEIKSFGDSPESAFDHVLERLEQDEIERGEETKVAKPLFSLLASSRVGGLSEEEIVTIIKDEYNLDEDEVRANVNLNLRQVRPFMARKEMRHDFFYEKFREAAESRYKPDYENDIKLLTDYFNDKSDKDEARRFVELPYYLHESNRIDELEDALSSYSFIKNKLEKTGDVYGLISDYEDYVDFEKVEDGPLELIQRGLELSSPVLMNHPEELPVQLWGRMNEIKEEDDDEDKHKYDRIRTLLHDLVEDTTGKWLKPTTSALYSPKSSIIKRLLPDGNKSSSQIAFTKDNKIIFGSSDGILSMYDIDDNSFEVLESKDSKIVKIILKDDGSLYVARFNGEIKKWDLTARNTEDYPDKNSKVEDYGEIRDIYVSDTYGKIYAVSHKGVFSIDIETKELKSEGIEPKNYNQILVPRRNEAILVCDEMEVDGWDVYEKRKAYNRHHQQNDEEDDGKQLDSSEEIRFMGLNKRFLTLISENGQMKFWNTLKNSGGGESIDEERVCSPNDKFKQALTLEDENKIITISEMGVLKVYNIPQPRQPKFNVEKNEKTGMELDIQTGIKSPTALNYLNEDDKRWVIVGNENNDVSIIDLDKKVAENTNVRHAESVLSIKINGNRMITSSDNGEVFTWDIDSEECLNKFENDFRCNSISFNRDESKLVLAGVKTDNDKKINKIATCDVTDDMWKSIEKPEIENDKQKEKFAALKVYDEKSGMGEVVEITQNLSGIVFIEENKLSIDDKVFELDGTATSVDALLSAADAYVGFKDGSIVKYPSSVSFERKVDCPVTKIKIFGEKLIAGYKDGSVEVFDLDGAHLASLKGHDKEINNIYVDDSRIITVSKDNTLKIWKNDECIYTYFLDIYATAVNIREDKLIVGDTLGNVRFFTFEN